MNGFGNPWEHIRLLSDRPRNEAMIELLARRAPGARVLEVGCGGGLFSCVAARLGATHVYAVEPTRMVDTARALVAENGLAGVVEVIEARIEDLEPRPVDLAFSELLNADPFLEGVLPAMEAARAWGPVAPRRLRVWAALAHAGSSAREAREAMAEASRVARTHGLGVESVLERMRGPVAWHDFTHAEAVAGPAVLAWELTVGEEARPQAVEVTLRATEPGPHAGLILWFEAELDEGLVLGNAPGAGGH